MQPVAKKFTARQLPSLLMLADLCKLDHHKVGSKTHQFTPASLRGDDLGVVGMSCEDMNAMEEFARRASETFAAYDLRIDSRGRFVSVTWAKDTRTQAQLDNVD